MTSFISRIWARLCAKRIPLSIMIVGLDNSGKTSILSCLETLDQNSANVSHPNQQSATNVRDIRELNEGCPLKLGCHPGVVPPTSANNSNLADNSGLLSSPSSSSAPASVGGCNIMPTVGYNYERVQYKGLILTVLDFSGQNRYRNLWQEFYNGVDGIVFVIDSTDLIRLVVARDELETMLSHPYFNTLNTISSSGQARDGNSTTMSAESANLLPICNSEAAQKQLTISQGKLIQVPLESLPFSSSSSSSSPNSALNLRTGNRSRASNQQVRRRTKVPILFLANKIDLANSADIRIITQTLNLSQLSAERHPWFVQATSVKLSSGIAEGFDWLVSQMSPN